MEPADIDRRLDQALERLPPPGAPRTLLPRVMQAVDLRAHAPWYRREWRRWPLGWRVLSLAACMALVALIWGRGPSLGLMQELTRQALAPAQAVTSQVGLMFAALPILWRVVLEPLVPALFGVAMLMCVACVTIVLMLNYVVMGRTWQQ